MQGDSRAYEDDPRNATGSPTGPITPVDGRVVARVGNA
jgi:hypothetical protein